MALVIKIVIANIRVQRSPQQYCGSRLADIMKAICKSKYNEQIKRSKIGKFKQNHIYDLRYYYYNLIPILNYVHI